MFGLIRKNPQMLPEIIAEIRDLRKENNEQHAAVMVLTSSIDKKLDNHLEEHNRNDAVRVALAKVALDHQDAARQRTETWAHWAQIVGPILALLGSGGIGAFVSQVISRHP